MIKVKNFNDVRTEDKVTINSSYVGYESCVHELDEWIKKKGTIVYKNNNAIEIRFTRPNGYYVDWWYPIFSLQFDGDDKPLNANTIKVDTYYRMMCDNLNPFRLGRYDGMLPDYNGELIEANNDYHSLQKGTRVKALQVIEVRPEYNDTLVLCQSNGKLYYLPITTLYNAVPSLAPKKFVYEYSQWLKKDI